MGDLTHQDVQKLLSAVAELHSEFTPATLAARTLNAVHQIVSSDYISFDGFTRIDNQVQEPEQSFNPDFTMTQTGLVHHSESWFDYEFDATPEELAIVDTYSHESPLFSEVYLKNSRYPLKTTDFISAREFHRTTIYNEYFRRGESRFHMGFMLPVSSELRIACSLGRKSKDFSEDDRLLLTMLAPHLAAAISNTRTFGELQTNKTHLETAMEAGHHAVVVLASDGVVRFKTDYAKRILEKYFTRERQGQYHLPESLKRWVAHLDVVELGGEFSPPPPVFIAKGEEGELHIRHVLNNSTGERMLLLEEKLRLTPSDLERLGLTKRESEVLFWSSKGKTDAEIAFLCGISPRTVQKHNQQIYTKLGVENRTAAVTRANEILR